MPRLDGQLRAAGKKLATLKASGTTLTEVFGVGPIAGTIIGDIATCPLRRARWRLAGHARA
jgi:hypothetical protein